MPPVDQSPLLRLTAVRVILNIDQHGARSWRAAVEHGGGGRAAGRQPATLYAYVSRGLLARERARRADQYLRPGRAGPPGPPGRPRRGRRPAAELVVASALTAIDQGSPGTAAWPSPTWPPPVGSRRWPSGSGRAGSPTAFPPGGPARRPWTPAAAPRPPCPPPPSPRADPGDRRRPRRRRRAPPRAPPAAVTAAGRALIAGLVDCLPRLAPRAGVAPPPARVRRSRGDLDRGPAVGRALPRRPGGGAGRGGRRRPRAAGRPRAGRVDGGGQGGRLGQGRPVRGGLGRAGRGQRDPPRGCVAGDRGPATRDRPARQGGERRRDTAAPGRAPPGLRPPPLPGGRPGAGVLLDASAPRPPGRRASRWWRPCSRRPPAVASPTPPSTSPWPPSPTSPP